ncbi:DUF397 domain-containing protein [Streptomyces beijiangensis]|uniref:DUF397 domain-containing protein n=1 Tax=Streptomyces beijiangensis TaxID=163361 RepID=A0A939JMJ5_9ACTN|nr:DUF397 domain-containing protein [Streptomyces beijiangensis]MBO0516844.1 DUF397 domain-containing protein [Streptomyces beijiangensis]
MTTNSDKQTNPVWVKSSYSAGDGGQCVEVARAVGTVRVRDSKRAAGPVLAVGAAEWAAFLRLAARG